ncbi:protein YhfH [Gracilibacillus sp. YIM 98692]|nr:protein YhfH [Gracilibacillus sp. YIM 98692]
MISIVEFFRNIPRKKCIKCGHTMTEQADCYHNVCDTCNDPAH